MSGHGKRPKIDISLEELITLRVDNDPRTIQAKKSDLTSCSTYFDTMFQSSFNESTSNTVTLSGDVVSYKILEVLVVFMETKQLKPTEATFEPLFVAADYLQINSALRVLCDSLYVDLGTKKLDDIRKGTVHMLLRLYDILNRFAKTNGYSFGTRTVSYVNSNTQRPQAVKCTNEVQLYIAYHFRTIMYDHELLKLDIDAFERVLKSDFLRLSEEEVVRIIKIWINFEFQDRRRHFGTLIKCVRFDEAMTVDFIMEEVLDFVDCSSAKDYVISIFAKKLGYKKDISDIGPANPKVRIHRRFDLKQDAKGSAPNSGNTSVVSIKDESVTTV